jgi:hypothetical protein
VASVVASAMPRSMGFNRLVLGDLRKGHKELFAISTKFTNVSSGITIHSFHEILALNGQGVVRCLVNV